MAHADAVEAIRPALKSRYHASLTMLPVMQFDAALTRDGRQAITRTPRGSATHYFTSCVLRDTYDAAERSTSASRPGSRMNAATRTAVAPPITQKTGVGSIICA